MSKAKYLVVVYQFGKVASTALVKSLNASPEVDAHQSHFLGENALQRMVLNATDRSVNAYFRTHMVGQLIANLNLTYEVNQTKHGDDDRELKVISLSREPLDWLRSCVQQDILGYRDDILAYAQNHCPANQHGSIEHGLSAILQRLTDVVEAKGGMPAILAEFKTRGGGQILDVPGLPCDGIVRRVFFLAIRPLSWFDDHFARCFGLGLADVPKRGNHWMTRRNGATFVILRYEDINAEFASAMHSAGVPFSGRLVHANESQGKLHAMEIRAAFDGEAAQRLRHQVLQSDYARHFGYAPDTDDGSCRAAPSKAETVSLSSP